jgi:hypothetical protein
MMRREQTTQMGDAIEPSVTAPVDSDETSVDPADGTEVQQDNGLRLVFDKVPYRIHLKTGTCDEYVSDTYEELLDVPWTPVQLRIRKNKKPHVVLCVQNSNDDDEYVVPSFEDADAVLHSYYDQFTKTFEDISELIEGDKRTMETSMENMVDVLSQKKISLNQSKAFFNFIVTMQKTFQYSGVLLTRSLVGGNGMPFVDASKAFMSGTTTPCNRGLLYWPNQPTRVILRGLKDRIMAARQAAINYAAFAGDTHYDDQENGIHMTHWKKVSSAYFYPFLPFAFVKTKTKRKNEETKQFQYDFTCDVGATMNDCALYVLWRSCLDETWRDDEKRYDDVRRFYGKRRVVANENATVVYADITETAGATIRVHAREEEQPLVDEAFVDSILNGDVKLVDDKMSRIADDVAMCAKVSKGPILVFVNAVDGIDGVLHVLTRLVQRGMSYTSVPRLVPKDDGEYEPILSEDSTMDRVCVLSGDSNTGWDGYSPFAKTEHRHALLEAYNSVENRTGRRVKVLVVTEAGSTGINVRNTHNVFKVGPFTNIVMAMQEDGRFARMSREPGTVGGFAASTYELPVIHVFAYLSVARSLKDEEAHQEIEGANAAQRAREKETERQRIAALKEDDEYDEDDDKSVKSDDKGDKSFDENESEKEDDEIIGNTDDEGADDDNIDDGGKEVDETLILREGARRSAREKPEESVQSALYDNVDALPDDTPAVKRNAPKKATTKKATTKKDDGGATQNVDDEEFTMIDGEDRQSYDERVFDLAKYKIYKGNMEAIVFTLCAQDENKRSIFRALQDGESTDLSILEPFLDL